MWLVVGLGNPGRAYEATRHNVGFMIVEALADRADARFSDKKFKARLARVRVGGQDALLMKPDTFMNLSGESVGPCAGFFKIPMDQIVVVHDDMDLDFGRLKLKQGGGHGGHNGLRSLLSHLPSDGFVRVRVGVGRPPPQWDPADWVLSRFGSDEQETLEATLKNGAGAVATILRQGMSRAMGRYNRTEKKRAPKPAKDNDDPEPTENGTGDDERSKRVVES